MSGTLPDSLRGRQLVLARAGWILVALVSVVGFAASVPAHYARALRYSGRNLHAPEAMKVGLERLGIPFEAYVFYWTAVLVLLAVVFFLVGAVIFWRRSDDPAALFFRSRWSPSGPYGPTPSTRWRASTRCSTSRARA